MPSVDEHDSSRPPPPPTVRPELPSHPDQVADDARRGRERSREALSVAREALEVGQGIRALLGESPDPARGIVGSGLLRGVSQLYSSLADLEARLEERDKVARELAAADALRIERRGTIARWVLLVLGAIGTGLGIWRGTR